MCLFCPPVKESWVSFIPQHLQTMGTEQSSRGWGTDWAISSRGYPLTSLPIVQVTAYGSYSFEKIWSVLWKSTDDVQPARSAPCHDGWEEAECFTPSLGVEAQEGGGTGQGENSTLPPQLHPCCVFHGLKTLLVHSRLIWLEKPGLHHSVFFSRPHTNDSGQTRDIGVATTHG